MGLRTMPCKRMLMLMHRTLTEGLGWLILMFIFKLSNSKCLICLSICDIISDAKIIDQSTRNICPTAVPCIPMKSRSRNGCT